MVLNFRTPPPEERPVEKIFWPHKLMQVRPNGWAEFLTLPNTNDNVLYARVIKCSEEEFIHHTIHWRPDAGPIKRCNPVMLQVVVMFGATWRLEMRRDKHKVFTETATIVRAQGPVVTDIPGAPHL